MTKIEELARAMVAPALKNASAKCAYTGAKREAFLDGIWQEAIPYARAAISAMREPNEAMKNALTPLQDSIHWDYSCHVCGGLRDGWYAMIDAALKETL